MVLCALFCTPCPTLFCHPALWLRHFLAKHAASTCTCVWNLTQYLTHATTTANGAAVRLLGLLAFFPQSVGVFDAKQVRHDVKGTFVGA